MTDTAQPKARTVSLFHGCEIRASEGIPIDWYTAAKRIDAALQEESARRMRAEEELAKLKKEAEHE